METKEAKIKLHLQLLPQIIFQVKTDETFLKVPRLYDDLLELPCFKYVHGERV